MQNERELIAKVLCDNDQEAFAILLKKYQSPIRSFFRKLLVGNIELADDLSQETFILVYKNLSQFRGDAKLLTWIYSVARNVYLSHVRKAKNQHPNSDEKWDSSYSMQTDAQLDIVQVFKVLNSEERLVLCLSYAEGLTHQEVAEMLNKPLGTIKTIILRAKEKVQDRFEKKKENVYETRS